MQIFKTILSISKLITFSFLFNILAFHSTIFTDSLESSNSNILSNDKIDNLAANITTTTVNTEQTITNNLNNDEKLVNQNKIEKKPISCCEETESDIKISVNSCATIEEGKLICGISPDNPPYEYIDANGNIVGIEVEIIKLIAEKLNMALEIKNIDFNGLISALIAKNIDLTISNITKTEDRKKVVDFSKSYLNSKNAVFFIEKNENKDLIANITQNNKFVDFLELLKDKKIGAQMSTTWFSYAQELQSDINFELKGMPSNITLVQEVKNSNIDYLIIDELQAGFICKNIPNTNYFIIPNQNFLDKKAIAFQKDSCLKARIDNIIKEMLKNGEIDEIIKKYQAK